MELFSALRWYLVLEPHHALVWNILLVLCVAGGILLAYCLRRQAFLGRAVLRALKGGAIPLVFLFLGGAALALPAEILHVLSRWRSELVVVLAGENRVSPAPREPGGRLALSSTTLKPPLAPASFQQSLPMMTLPPVEAP